MIDIYVYGAAQICASCVNLPSSKETYDWLETVLARKYGSDVFQLHYVDIYSPATEKQKQFCQKIWKEELWYPVVIINDEVVAEGNPNLKSIYKKLEELGLKERGV